MDIVALLAGIKPLAHIGLTDEDHYEKFRSVADFFGLAYAPLKVSVRGETLRVFFARERDAVELARKLWTSDFPAVQKLLGYPSCCERSFDRAPEDSDIIPLIGRSTGSVGPFPFYMNTVLHYSGREPAVESFGSVFPRLHLLPWQPCSFRCPDSLKAGAVMWEVCADLMPEFSRCVQQVLATLVLQGDEGECALLSGRALRAGRYRYDAVFEPVMLKSSVLAGLLAEGDTVEVHERSFIVSRGRRRLGAVPCERPIILDFSAR